MQLSELATEPARVGTDRQASDRWSAIDAPIPALPAPVVDLIRSSTR